MEAAAKSVSALPIEAGAFVERRTSERFAVRGGAIASPLLTVVGQITDMSPEGLAFRYVARHQRSTESEVLSITLTDGTFQLNVIPYTVIWDVAEPKSFSCGSICMRHCGVQFGELMDYQEVALQFFVHHYTTAAGSFQ